MATINPTFASECPKILQATAEVISQSLGVPLEFSVESTEIEALAPVFRRMGKGAVCCRSAFARKVSGIGGILLPDALAAGLAASKSNGAFDPQAPFEFDDPTRVTLEQTWETFLGSWNSAASPDYRMSGKAEERAVEYYPTSVPFPPEAGVIPFVLPVLTKVDGQEFEAGLCLPLRAVQGTDLQGFTPPEQFVRCCVPLTTGNDRPPTRNVQKPVVFVDCSGDLLYWLMNHAKQAGVRCVLSDSIDPELLQAKGGPAATVLVGFPPEKLQEVAQLEDCSFVEIHRA